MTMAGGWERAGRARREFADLIEGLEPDQFDAATPCGDWTPRHILGHLTSFVDIGFGAFFANMARHRFDYDAAADTMARRQAERPVDELVATLRSKAEKTAWLPIFPETLTVADAVIHAEDVRRGVGSKTTPDQDLLREALEFLTTHKMAKNLGGPDLSGLSLSATDLDWSNGSGPSIEGPATTLMLAMAGRAVLDDLGGDGVDRLRSA